MVFIHRYGFHRVFVAGEGAYQLSCGFVPHPYRFVP